MIIVPTENIRKYVAIENGKWIHDPNMPDNLLDEFNQFVNNFENQGRRAKDDFFEKN